MMMNSTGRDAAVAPSCTMLPMAESTGATWQKLQLKASRKELTALSSTLAHVAILARGLAQCGVGSTTNVKSRMPRSSDDLKR